MTLLQQADHLVRNHPANKELYKPEWSICSAHQELDADCKLCQTGWERCHLEHYLRVLEDCCEQLSYVQLNGTRYLSFMANKHPMNTILFNLTTGKPATEKDAEEFIKLVT